MAVSYKVYDLGFVRRDSVAFGLNDLGFVVAKSHSADGPPCGWTVASPMRQLGFMPFGNFRGSVYKVNNSGVACGSVAWLVNGVRRENQPCRWSAVTGYQLMAVPQGSSVGFCYDVNEDGAITGMLDGQLGQRAFVWKTGAVAVLPNLPGGFGYVSNGINNLGECVGGGVNASHMPRALYWSGSSGAVDLGVLPGYTQSQATSINDLGLIVGTCYSGSLGLTGFVTTVNGPMQRLEGANGEVFLPNKVNNKGEIVGNGLGLQGEFAGLYVPGAGLLDLNLLAEGGTGAMRLLVTYDINENGDVCGLAVENGLDRAFYARRL